MGQKTPSVPLTTSSSVQPIMTSTNLRNRRVFRIDQLMRDNESSESQRVSRLRVTRACPTCPNEQPVELFYCCSCRHVVCGDCLCTAVLTNKCPLCEKQPSFVKLREDEVNPLQCDICDCPDPVQRAIFRGCGHTTCGACAQRITVQARDHSKKPRCPFCRVHCWPWPIKEHVLREDGEKLGARFSIACRCCKDEKPARRFVYISCGHTFCSKCTNESDSCPVCAVSTTFTRIFEQSGSRRCEICFIKEPSSRAVLRDCGHTACTACLVQLRLVTNDQNEPLFCPFCRTKMTDEPIQIREKLIKSKVEPVAKRKMTPVQLKAADRKRKTNQPPPYVETSNVSAVEPAPEYIQFTSIPIESEHPPLRIDGQPERILIKGEPLCRLGVRALCRCCLLFLLLVLIAVCWLIGNMLSTF
ncbi:hypothetical protein PRIPAC_81475 [Pristionchus pacificus]|uniref:Uncharacterized protein n=1 Tax=Pristionchus pacificus TaxID=54126 RepID=A0A2A6BH75_PRIPA|nr:hypothetical protein PRIPAC_81475 [Pristionchus pacificus]|eukprot:PDM65239.1 hypothetical protein PRIPAC_52181 [Pristionchus pacificus]